MHVGAELGAARLDRLIAQNVAIVIKRLLRKRRNELRMVRQVVDAHVQRERDKPPSYLKQACSFVPGRETSGWVGFIVCLAGLRGCSCASSIKCDCKHCDEEEHL